MNEKEIRKLIKDLKTQFSKSFPNKKEEEIEKMILDMFFKAYCEDKMCREDLTTLTEVMGYEVDDEILDQIEQEKKEGEK